MEQRIWCTAVQENGRILVGNWLRWLCLYLSGMTGFFYIESYEKRNRNFQWKREDQVGFSISSNRRAVSLYAEVLDPKVQRLEISIFFFKQDTLRMTRNPSVLLLKTCWFNWPESISELIIPVDYNQ